MGANEKTGIGWDVDGMWIINGKGWTIMTMMTIRTINTTMGEFLQVPIKHR